MKSPNNLKDIKKKSDEFLESINKLKELIPQVKTQYEELEKRVTQLEKEMNSVIISVDRLEELHN